MFIYLLTSKGLRKNAQLVTQNGIAYALLELIICTLAKELTSHQYANTSYREFSPIMSGRTGPCPAARRPAQVGADRRATRAVTFPGGGGGGAGAARCGWPRGA